MKLFLLLLSAIAVNSLSDQELWNEYKVKFSKEYTNRIEEINRFNAFQQKIRKIEEHNSKYYKGEVTYTMGVNQFSDLTEEEYLSMLSYSMSIRPPRPENVNYVKIPKERLADLPDHVDWRERNAVTEVKNQGACGSCWAFSSTGGLEGQYALKHGQLVSLSEQNLLDCAVTYGTGNCTQGGIMEAAFEYVKDNGINSEDAYPYEARLGSCHYRADQSVLHITGYDFLEQNEDALKYAVATFGPISVAIDFSLAGDYQSGIFDNKACNNDPNKLNHGVLVVGYGTENGIDYWIVKNSWSPNFGENGYIRMIRNSNNQCGISDNATRPLVV